MERVCSECGGSISGRSTLAKTCSDKCRAERSRRIKRSRANAAKLPEHLKIVSEITKGQHTDALQRVVEEEIRPVVRESITEDVMRSINDLVALTPEAIDAIKDDLRSDDKTLRNRAYTLLIKYTIGHRALVPTEAEEEGKNLVVNFNMPRPGDDGTELVVDADELQPCDSCGIDKPMDQFVANSNRCQDCFDAARHAAEKYLEGENAD